MPPTVCTPSWSSTPPRRFPSASPVLSLPLHSPLVRLFPNWFFLARPDGAQVDSEPLPSKTLLGHRIPLTTAQCLLYSQTSLLETCPHRVSLKPPGPSFGHCLKGLVPSHTEPAPPPVDPGMRPHTPGGTVFPVGALPAARCVPGSEAPLPPWLPSCPSGS